MKLTPEQQEVAAEAAKLIPACIRAFKKKMPCLREVAELADLEGAAMLGCCRAARTYDPSRGFGLSAYFSIAIRNAMLREVQREIRSRAHAKERISLEAAAQREPPKRPAPQDATLALQFELTEEERAWIEAHVFDGVSLRSFGRQHRVSHQTARRTLRAHLDRLRKACTDPPEESEQEPS